MNVRFNNLREQLIDDEPGFLEDLQETILNSDFVMGESVTQFESLWSSFVGTNHTIGVANGSDALRIALRAVGISKGHKVAVVGNTYFAAAAAVLHVGATPIFFDVNEETRFPSNFDYGSLIDAKPAVIVRSHLFGHADLAQVPDELEDAKIIHDCSQAHGTYIGSSHVGSTSLSTFSFYPGKNLGALGDAGAISVHDEYLANKIRQLRNQGIARDRYVHEVDGFNSRLDTLQAKFLLRRFKSLELNNRKRRGLAKMYDEAFSQLENQVVTYPPPKGVTSSFHLYQIRIRGCNAADVQDYLKRHGIETGRHYPISLDQQQAFKGRSEVVGSMSACHLLAQELLSLPLHPNLKKSEIEHIVEVIGKFLRLFK